MEEKRSPQNDPRDVSRPLEGRRLLVPPARPRINPLGRMLEQRGAEVVVFARREPLPPADWGPMDGAIGAIGRFDWKNSLLAE